MKKFFVISSLILFSLFTFAQDIVIKKNGEEIKCIVVDVTTEYVKCKKFNSEDETEYRFLLKDVSSIIYMNGETVNLEGRKDVPISYTKGFWGLNISRGTRVLNSEEIRELYADHEEALSKYNGGKTKITIGNIIGLPSAFIFGYQLGAGMAGGEINSTVLVVSGVGFLGGMILSLSGTSSIKQSVEIYNSEVSSTASLNLKMGFTQNGVGLCLSF